MTELAEAVDHSAFMGKGEAILGESLRESVDVVEEVGKPGTNWTQVTPENRKRIDGIVRHYMKQAHPFTACVRDNTKRFGKERAERICAVVKDMGRRTTKWRKGGDGKVSEDEFVESIVAELLEAGGGEFDEVAVPLAEYLEHADEVLSRDEPVGVLGEALKVRPLSKSNKARPGDRDYGQSTHDPKKHPRGAKGTSQGGKFISKGSTGSSVKTVQKAVGVKRPDGTFGAQTAEKVKAFQKQHGLKVDGVVGHQTALAIAGRYETARKATPGALTGESRSAAGLRTESKKPKRRTAVARGLTRARGGRLLAESGGVLGESLHVEE